VSSTRQVEHESDPPHAPPSQTSETSLLSSAYGPAGELCRYQKWMYTFNSVLYCTSSNVAFGSAVTTNIVSSVNLTFTVTLDIGRCKRRLVARWRSTGEKRIESYEICRNIAFRHCPPSQH